ncbi:1,4-alpha-glucan branching enzyme [Komagataeibacter rhaeticus]|uniref:1,4-alpha-glucan branching protein GlgB n=1 Tax=Komagataeibacter rhaeticus TaxID=215221 RepID=UPI0004D7DBDC|nr:1,4-alpha-glucan branching protein GlgB [Komagataeibacter rhaeticus]KDU95453.1 glycogen branching protein [Komagataeibacter rhaeticus AF1]MBL7239489.1 1,4-alpha-glucan branching protein GlgB [Komagataeibacter rhaeticus]PYD54302.1 1,4-alpha-glucan branching enzyme [Komagataeibacter rhaeticus]GBQ14800.1 glycogen branching protein [Komagataeibacter rhaeticus DSM 16663]
MRIRQDEAHYRLPPGVDDLVHGRSADPFSILGRHNMGKVDVIRVMYHDAARVRLVVERPRGGEVERPMRRMGDTGLHVGTIAAGARYHLKIVWADAVEETADPYSFGLLLDGETLRLFSEGRHASLDRVMGAQPMVVEHTPGVRFAVWAPNARRVSVIGDFNFWDGRRHPMRLRHEAGVWELFIPGLGPGERYKFEIMARDGHILPQKADPFARFAERPPATASVIAPAEGFAWTDGPWMDRRGAAQAHDSALSIYELHVPSWRRPQGDPERIISWRELAAELIPYVRAAGFTHVELMPVMEYPFGGSWGYQPLGLFAPSARHGTPADFAGFVDACHGAGIGVILDWVPAHFPNDVHGLVCFDGCALYEHQDPREGVHRDWNTHIYNLGRHEVRGFLISSALMWLERYHIDGLRVDAVASMLYRDYSRGEGEWIPNIHGGRENLEAVAFLRQLNETVHATVPDAMMIAEESTAWPGVTHPVAYGGLGFSYKWNMGWMHDSLRFFARDPLWRGFHLHEILFGLHYAFSEHFILCVSHDEVTHGKGALLARMPGDDWQRHANMRLFFAFMWAHPGRKLIFMGSEFGQDSEWSHEGEPDWSSRDNPFKSGLATLVGDLNHLYRSLPALHARDSEPAGFAWIIGDDTVNTVLAWLRLAPARPPVLVVLNLTPVPRHDYRVGVPVGGLWRECLNSDATPYGGSGVGNGGTVWATDQGAHGQPCSCVLTLPPLAALYLHPAGEGA